MSTTWPASLPQYPQLGFTQRRSDNVLRSSMGYGPDKLRRRTTTDIEILSIPLTLTTAQVETLRSFYISETSDSPPGVGRVGTIGWKDFLSTDSPLPSIDYRFLNTPTYQALGNSLWSVMVELEQMP